MVYEKKRQTLFTSEIELKRLGSVEVAWLIVFSILVKRRGMKWTYPVGIKTKRRFNNLVIEFKATISIFVATNI